ncbi:hypothetical protein CAPTEDRAFT_157153 [Capitella teleta]|uniref:PNPLA domain-containing protein n=1 Tax=Capitella teleta TaxID=283909 RepID=R7T5W3_CAPTE|nr:hypothetical protein CAPTEDRAFT_157153 [Capitella teleta]|eukprot:ELT88710.1 hypothetical protein CAPTEDRAFT_157153 [Capitella teleta]
MNLSFCGCGFLGLYHLGVAKTLVQKGRPLFEKVDRFCGASAGSLIAALLATKGPDEEQSIDFCYNLAADVRKVRFKSLNPKVSLLDPLEEFLLQALPPDAHQLASGKLFVSVTRKKKNSIVSEFQSRDELIKYLLASSYIPRITGKEPIYIHDRRFLDGGMTNNLPIPMDGRTVTVSPFAGRQDICPPDASRKPMHMNLAKQRFRVNLKNMRRAYHAFLPPKKEKMDKYFNQGVRDAEAFLIREGYIEEKQEAPLPAEEQGAAKGQ